MEHSQAIFQGVLWGKTMQCDWWLDLGIDYSKERDCLFVLFGGLDKINFIDIQVQSTNNMLPYICNPGIILCMCQANERQRYIVILPIIGWACIQNDPW